MANQQTTHNMLWEQESVDDRTLHSISLSLESAFLDIMKQPVEHRDVGAAALICVCARLAKALRDERDSIAAALV